MAKNIIKIEVEGSDYLIDLPEGKHVLYGRTIDTKNLSVDDIKFLEQKRSPYLRKKEKPKS